MKTCSRILLALVVGSGCASEDEKTWPSSDEHPAEVRPVRTSTPPETRIPLMPATPIPAIDARVAAVKTDVDPPLCLLSVGSDDRVEKGFHFSVYRGSEFVGKVVVERVLKDSCGCRVLFTKEGLTIQAGDMAATRLQ